MKYDNYTLYGIHDKTERQLLVGYKSFILISSLMGDTLILIGSLRYNAIRLHKILVIIIQHIAAADLLLAIFSVLPGVVSLAANRWILGDIFCYMTYFANVNCGVLVCQLMSGLALSKMLIVQYPLRAIHFSGKAAHLSACVMWVYSFIFPVAAIARDKSGVYFSYLVYNCDYTCSPIIWKPLGWTLYDISCGLSVLLPTIVIVVSSVVLVVLAKRVADRGPGGLQWQGVLTVLLTVAAHIAAALPLEIFYITAGISRRSSNPNNSYLEKIYRYGWFIGTLTVTINFYIFTLTLKSFRDFLKSGMRTLAAPLMRCCSANEDERSLLEDGKSVEEDGRSVEEDDRSVEEDERSEQDRE